MKKKLLTGLATGLFLFGVLGVASATTIDFQTSPIGTEVYDQFSSMSVHFRNSLDISAAGAPGSVVPANQMQVYNYSQGVYFILDSPIHSLSAFVYEFESGTGGSPPGNDNEKFGTVMFDFIGSDAEELAVHEGEKVIILKDVGEWLLVKNPGTGQEGYVPASYIEQMEQSVHLEVFRLNKGSYVLIDDSTVVHALNKWDEVRFESTTPIDAFRLRGTQDFYIDTITLGAPVPEPTTMLLLALGLISVAGVRRKFKK
jgi:hypothetical protein